jgi:transposase-like protein
LPQAVWALSKKQKKTVATIRSCLLYILFPLSLRNVEDLPHERGIEISHETVRF